VKTVEEQDKEAEITLDRRDLFDAVRTALKDAMLDQGSRMDDVELYEDATDRTNECLRDLFGHLRP
jgi:hypothetical protein